ncbi:LysE family translocator [Lentibacter sp. XHP0401]|jgi:homoserine/homoserine lactone efflux protein|uniref:LysE family translocator n=1 Tax=Lentibacter sp. XHP0401 TaxID=2984334 RepID=UPI0021E7A3B5|nr:LysE family translocator [Lentibacter sp. XHP0401]MCV2892495.1 LysE family translocator [Lentibacter sp. XHP0401]
MSFEAWTIFALFWLVFVTTPGPNAVNCIQSGMSLGFLRALPAVAAILCQASLFLTLSAFGITALLAASPTAFLALKYAGAGFLVYLGLRAILRAHLPIEASAHAGRTLFWRSFLIATINPKSVAGYLAAFSQFVDPNAPIAQQMWVIVPTALTLTSFSYCTYTALGTGLGKLALGAVFNAWFRRVMGLCFIAYGLALGATTGRM